MDTQSQHELHTTFGMLGEYTKTQFGLACNAFAGESACVSIDRGSSDIARFCNLEPTQIDCMFYSEDMVDMREVGGGNQYIVSYYVLSHNINTTINNHNRHLWTVF